MDNIDVVIAAFEDEGRNVIAALQARQLEIQKVVAIVQNHEYTQLLEQNSVVVVNAPWATAAMVENIIDNPVLAQLFEFGIGAASLLEVSVAENAKVIRELIKDIDIPKGCLIAAIMRNNQFVVPRGTTRIEVDDRVIFIGPASAIKKAYDIFMIKK
jgi:Trk K+ transport system NAD-binding subunit